MENACLGVEAMRFDTEFQTPDLQPLLEPASIAVVGASENPGPGLQILENLEQLGYRGEIYPVNPHYSQVLGMPCFPSLAAVRKAGHDVDLAAILLNRNLVLPILKEAAQIGARAAWAFANGFAEADEEGRDLQRRITDLCTEHNILFCGPNCVGLLNYNKKVASYSAPVPREILAGDIGMVAQSGYVCIQVANANRGLRFSMICSAGNEAVVDATDYIGYMLEDTGTRVIMAFIEQFRRPERLPALARRARELCKPIVLIKVGRSEMAARASAAHTGALAGSDDVQDALFKQLGLIRVDDLDEMFETAELFSKLGGRLPRGNGLFAVTLSGGVISLLGDLGENLNLRFPQWSAAGRARVQEYLPPYAGVENPLDAWGFGKVEEAYLPCLTAAAEEKEADLILVSQDVPGGMAPRQVEQYTAVAEAAAVVYRQTDRPVVFLSNPSGGFDGKIRSILDKAGVPLLQGSKEGLRAIDHAIAYSGFLASDPIPAPTTEPSPAADKVRPLFDRARGALTELESKQVLAAYGVTCTREVLCTSAEKAVAAAQWIGAPVALKVMSPQILHKTEAGVIALNLKDEQAIRRSYDRLMESAHAYDSKAQIDGVLCQQMASGAVVEAIVGLLIDPQFGPAVIFGMGGIMVEVLGDRALGIPPLDRKTARYMIEQTRTSKLLRGFRGAPPADIEALIDVLLRVGNLGLDWSERIEALDINPLLILPEGQGTVAVDALLVLKDNEEKQPQEM